jgi:glycosyltransferase involved in cell wall biosynthesis
VIHVHIGGTLNRNLLLLCLACGVMPGSKSVLTFHSGGYPLSPEGRTARPATLRGLVFRQLDGIIAVNPAIEKLFHQFGVPPERVRLIHPHSVAPAPAIAFPERLEAFLRSHRPFLLTVGLLEREYDLPLQIEALGRVREQYPEAGLVIAGAGRLESDLRQLIATKSWAEHILLWGDLPHPVTLRAIAECDVLLRTTLYDGDSIAIREALASGTPVIATDNAMRPSGVRLIPAQNIGALVAAIGSCLESRAKGQAHIGSADESNLAAVLQLYEELTVKRG